MKIQVIFATICLTGGALDFQAAVVTSSSYPKTENGFHKRGTGTLDAGPADRERALLIARLGDC